MKANLIKSTRTAILKDSISDTYDDAIKEWNLDMPYYGNASHCCGGHSIFWVFPIKNNKTHKVANLGQTCWQNAILDNTIQLANDLHELTDVVKGYTKGLQLTQQRFAYANSKITAWENHFLKSLEDWRHKKSKKQILMKEKIITKIKDFWLSAKNCEDQKIREIYINKWLSYEFNKFKENSNTQQIINIQKKPKAPKIAIESDSEEEDYDY